MRATDAQTGTGQRVEHGSTSMAVVARSSFCNDGEWSYTGARSVYSGSCEIWDLVVVTGVRRHHRPQLSDEAAAYVRELIMSGQIRSGDFIRQDAVADELGMSATPVREGLLALRGEGFVHLEPRRGFVVSELSPDDIRDLFDAQALLAGELAARASQRLSKDALDELAAIQKRLDQAAGEGAASDVESLNHSFHRLVNTSAASPKIAWMLLVSVRYAPRRFFADIEGWAHASVLDHAAVLDALRARSEVRSRAAMEEHLRNAGHLLVEHVAAAAAAERLTLEIAAPRAD